MMENEIIEAIADDNDKETNETNTEINDETEAITVSKFKNPDELAKAYSELEKEFTRRSQRLATLEKELAKKEQPLQEDWKQTVDKFFLRTPAAKPFAKDMAKEIIADPTLRENGDCLDVALTRVLLSKFKTPEQMLSDGQFLKEHVLESDVVKKAVIEDYLCGLKEGKPPVLMGEGGEITVTSKNKPRTLEEAGAMFRKINE